MRELTFSDDKKMRARLLPHGFVHAPVFPARMHLGLLNTLVREYTQPGDVILEPFGGSGSTMLAALEGRHTVLVELESHWVECARRNAAHLSHQMMPPTGEIVIWQGDSRYDLTALTIPVYANAVVTSPPFFNDLGREGREHEADQYLSRMNVSRGIRAQSAGYSGADAVLTSPPYLDAVGSDGGPDTRPERMEGTAPAATAIHNGYGASAVLTSPPYAERFAAADPEADQADDPTAGQRGRIHRRYSSNGQNIGNLRRYGDLDAVLTSPPYERAVGSRSTGLPSAKIAEYLAQDPASKALSVASGYGGVDAVLTSPPYQDAIGNERSRVGKKIETYLKATGHTNSLACETGYAERRGRGNIGELRGQTYLEAMALVWSGCFAALRPSGLLVAVVGNVVRDHKEVDVAGDNARLLEQCGFVRRETFIHKKANLSFWRRLHAKRHPDDPVIDREWVIVCQKPSEVPA